MSDYFMGVDLGSTSAKAVILDASGDLTAACTIEMGTVSREGMRQAIERVLDTAGLQRSDVTGTVGTGYGRRLIPGGVDKIFTEITCHARGVAALCPGVRLVIDIGGQDNKAIAVDEMGMVVDFAMNDRCAAGTGRFYEVLGRAIETEVADLGQLALSGNANIEVSSICATFAATEVISLIAVGEAPENIAASVHRAISSRTLALVAQVGKRTPIVMTGGVAKNPAAVFYLSQALGEPLQIPPDPQVTGAYGAALLAEETFGHKSQVAGAAVVAHTDEKIAAALSSAAELAPIPVCATCGGAHREGGQHTPISIGQRH